MGRNISIDSQLKIALSISNDKTKSNKTKKDKEKENNTDQSDVSENEILDLNSLKPFYVESKTNIRVIKSSSSDYEEEVVEYKVKRIGDNEWWKRSTVAVVDRCSSENICVGVSFY